MLTLSRWYGYLLDGMVTAAGLLLLFMTVMIGADVFLRNIGAGGIPPSNELSEDSLYLITLLAAPGLLRQGQHIRIDILLRMLPERVGWLLEWVGDIVGLICCLFFVWYGVGNAEWTSPREPGLEHRPGAVRLQRLGTVLVETELLRSLRLLRWSAVLRPSVGMAAPSLAALVVIEASGAFGPPSPALG